MKTLYRKIRHGTLFMILLIMPVGVRIDTERAGELTIEGHAGSGQLSSVIRDCSGSSIASDSSTFTDFTGAVQYSYRKDDGSFVVFGLRGGHFRMDYQRATLHSVPWQPYSVEYTYWNPHVAYETPLGGIGLGWLSDAPTLNFMEGDEGVPITAHIRMGSYAALHFLTTYNENLPMMSGGGNVITGVGYPAFGRTTMFTGFSFLPYDRPGLVQKISWRVSDRFDFDLNGRVGSAGGKFEGSFSLGLRYHLPMGEPVGRNPFLEQREREKALKEEPKPVHKEVG